LQESAAKQLGRREDEIMVKDTDQAKQERAKAREAKREANRLKWAALEQDVKGQINDKADNAIVALRQRAVPVPYSDAIATEICERMGQGQSLEKICELPHMPAVSSVMRWLNDISKASFRDDYTRARERLCDALLDQCVTLADEALNPDKMTDDISANDSIQHARLMIETRIKAIGKMLPKKYGDLSRMELTGADGGAIQMRSVTMTIDSAVLDASQRDVLRQALIAARDGHNVIEHDSDKTADKS